MIEGLEVIEDLMRDSGKLAEYENRAAAKSIREILLRQGRKRFGEPGADVVQAFEAIPSVETLQQLEERLLEVESWEELLAAA
jgi:hypothetical protein